MPPPGKGLFLVDPEWGRPIAGPDGRPIRPTAEIRRRMPDLPPVPKGTPPFNQQGDFEPVIITYDGGAAWTAHNMQGEKHPIRTRVPVTLTPEEARHLGLEDYTPPKGGWQTRTDWRGILELGKDALDVYDRYTRTKRRKQ